jgi:hypothetical protein
MFFSDLFAGGKRDEATKLETVDTALTEPQYENVKAAPKAPAFENVKKSDEGYSALQGARDASVVKSEYVPPDGLYQEINEKQMRR